MKLEAISIKRFRSIGALELVNCGAFNVFIGKNNSGKSNILSAVNAFFSCVQQAHVVVLQPSIGNAIDFHEGKTDEPIELGVRFSLTLAERDGLIQDIGVAAAQVKHALEGLDPSLQLSVTLRIVHEPRQFAYVSRICLVPPSRQGSTTSSSDRLLLEVSGDSAAEIAERQTSIRSIREVVENLREANVSRLDDDDFRRILKEKEPQYIYYSLLRHRGLPTVHFDTMNLLHQFVQESKILAEFKDRIQSHIGNQTSIAESLAKKPLQNKVHTFAGHDAAVPDYATNLLRRISEMKVHYLTDRRKQIGKDEAERLLALKVRRGGPEKLHIIQETVAALLGVKIDAFQASRKGSEAAAELDVDNFLIEVNGSGIREALRLVLDVEFEHPAVILAEEPEMHLHPALETTMMRYLKRISSACQVFITTHSTSFLDTAEMKNVYLVSKPDSTHAQLIDFEEAESQIPKELGIRLSSLFMYDRLVLVEAPSDESVFREWSSKLSVNLSRANVGFISMHGARDLHYFASEAILGFLTRRQVKLWFLVDRDERDSTDIAKLERVLGDRAVVKVLSRREIENYLICPRALVEFISIKRQMAGSKQSDDLPSEHDVQTAIEEAADKLQDTAVQKRTAKELCRPIYPKLGAFVGDKEELVSTIAATLQKHIDELAELKTGVQESWERHAEWVKLNWSAQKLSIVPGDVLLDNVCERYGVRFKKERDGVRLAALMRESEIDEEFKSIIREIGT